MCRPQLLAQANLAHRRRVSKSDGRGTGTEQRARCRSKISVHVVAASIVVARAANSSRGTPTGANPVPGAARRSSCVGGF